MNFERDFLNWLILNERLTGNDLALDGALLSAADPHPDYRDDGFSVESSHGCRRIRAVDERIAELIASGDELERKVAQDFPQWFGFGGEEVTDGRRRFVAPWELPAEELSDLNQAKDRYVVMVGWMNLAAGGMFVAGFSLRTGDQGDPWRAVPGHAYLWAGGNEGMDKQIENVRALLPDALLRSIDTRIENERRAGEPGRPQPSPRR